MKTVVYKKYGPPEVLVIEEREKPTIKDHQVLIQVHATSVTPMDYRARGAKMPLWPFTRVMTGIRRPKQDVLGIEVAGEIVEVGPEVTEFKKGDRIFGLANESYAEYVIARGTEGATITTLPDNLSYEDGTAVPVGGLTSLYYLRTLGNIQAGHKILINGASGGVGVYAVQLAKYFGAEVTGVCSTKNVDLVKSLGADIVIDYTKTDFTKEKEEYDIVFDAVGKSSFSKCKKILQEDGIYLSTVPSYRLLLQMFWTSKVGKKKAKFGLGGGPEELRFLKDLLSNNDIRAVVGRTYPFEQIVEAHAHADKGHKVGSLVITLNQGEVAE